MAMGSSAHAEKIDAFSDLRDRTQYRAGAVEINVARHAGYCWGVQRAYDQIIALAESSDEPVTTLGPLIHNPQTIAELQEKYHVNYVNDVAEFSRGKVVIRTHGVPLEIQEQFKAKGAEVIDATCPYVRVTQNYAALLHRKKYHVVIIGDPHHPEVISIKSYAQGEATVVKTVEDVEGVPRNRRRLGVVIQSTVILENVNRIIAKLLERGQELRIFNTICYVTTERQEDAEKIARENEFVVVIGGKESSNTKKLAVVAERFGARTQLIEGPADLHFGDFERARKIGVLAGASTPNWLIDEVIAALERHFNGTTSPISGEDAVFHRS